MSRELLTAETAGINPEKFSDDIQIARRPWLIGFLIILMLAGFGLRVSRLGAESFGEDELNKLETVADYRTNGLSGRNGEHPFLMKGLQMASLLTTEKWNDAVSPERQVSDEAALRLPTVLTGTLTILILFLLVSELFGPATGLVAAALWALEPTAIAFDRVAKEDSFLLCFFLLTNFFWLRGQSAAERGRADWFKYAIFAAISFAALMASKYLPHLLAVSAAYYIIFQEIPATRWRLGKYRWLMFFAVSGIFFLIFNPTILIPETWREMLKFSAEQRIGHDSYEFMGALYQNKMTAWLAGVPWTFYYVFIAVKTSLPVLVLALAGISLLFRRKLGDGRYFLFFWALMWFLPFSVLGGKFTRYFAVAEPLILIAAAVGFCFLLQQLTRAYFLKTKFTTALQAILFLALLAPSILNSLSVTPHFRLFTSTFGGGRENAGFYFPHDEFYDTSTREAVAAIMSRACPGAVTASEAPGVFAYYAGKAGRPDLKFVSLSDTTDIKNLAPGDFIAAAAGRRYLSNTPYLNILEQTAQPFEEIKIEGIVSVKIYQLDQPLLERLQNAAQ